MIWKIVKDEKKLYVAENLYSPCHINLIYPYSIKNSIKNIAEKLELNVTATPNENVTDDILHTAVEMFTYLILCPPKILQLYQNLFKDSSPNQILLALSSILKATQNANKESTIEIYTKVMEKLKLFNYQHFQKLQNENHKSPMEIGRRSCPKKFLFIFYFFS